MSPGLSPTQDLHGGSPGGAALLQFRRVRKLPDQRVMSNRLEELERKLIERIDQRRRMSRIEIEWRKLHPGASRSFGW